MNNTRASSASAAGAASDTGARAPRLLSVGHSNHDLAVFVSLLQQAAITRVADVRSQPVSGRYPQYNQAELKLALQEHGIAYVFMGDTLGGRPRQPSLYDREGRADYERVRATAAFQRGLDQLCGTVESDTVVMLCSEEDPLDCHRGLMIAPALVERDVLPYHLRGNGTIESTEQFEERLLVTTRVREGMLDGLFAAMLTAEERRQFLTEAYRVQARRKAFRLRPEQTAALPFAQDEDYDYG